MRQQEKSPAPDANIRGSGRTTRQMLAAPRNAVYVMPASCAIVYFRNLARALARTDLTLVSPRWFARCSHGHDGPVVIDHGTDHTVLERVDQGPYLRAVEHFRSAGQLVDVE